MRLRGGFPRLAAEASGPGNARDFYRKAGSYETTFYGQLALQKLGQTRLNVPYPSPTAADRTNYQRNPAVQAIARLEAVEAKVVPAGRP